MFGLILLGVGIALMAFGVWAWLTLAAVEVKVSRWWIVRAIVGQLYGQLIAWAFRWDYHVHNMDGVPVLHVKKLFRLPWWGRDIEGKWQAWQVHLHKIVRADRKECYHSHPSKAIRIILWSGYDEQTWPGNGWQLWEPGDMGFIHPHFVHRIDALTPVDEHALVYRPSWSLWIRGPIVADIKLYGAGWDNRINEVL